MDDISRIQPILILVVSLEESERPKRGSTQDPGIRGRNRERILRRNNKTVTNANSRIEDKRYDVEPRNVKKRCSASIRGTIMVANDDEACCG